MPMPHKQTEPVALVLALAGTVHAGRHSSTLKALRITMVGPYSQALLTLYGPPDCRRRYTEGPGDLVRIALYLYDPHLNNLKGVTFDPVSQTRVCDTTQPGRVIHMDRSGVDQKLVRRPPCSGATAGAG